MAIKAELEETSRNAAAAGLAALGVAFLLFAATATAGALFEAFGGSVSGGDAGVLAVVALAAILVAVVAVLFLRAGSSLRDGYGEQPIVKAAIGLGLAFALLGVVFVVPAFADSGFPGDLPLGILLTIAGVLVLVAGNSYRSVSASVAATGAIFGIAAGAVLVSVQIVGGDAGADLGPVAAIAEPALIGVVPAVGLVALATGGLLRAFLWDTRWSAAATGVLNASVVVLGLGMLIEGAGGLAALPWDALSDLGVQEVVLATGLAAGRALFTVAGFLLVSGAGLGFAAATARLYDRFGLEPKRPRARVSDDGGTNGGPRSCRSCEAELPAEAAYCPSCGEQTARPSL